MHRTQRGISQTRSITKSSHSTNPPTHLNTKHIDSRSCVFCAHGVKIFVSHVRVPHTIPDNLQVLYVGLYGPELISHRHLLHGVHRLVPRQQHRHVAHVLVHVVYRHLDIGHQQSGT